MSIADTDDTLRDLVANQVRKLDLADEPIDREMPTLAKRARRGAPKTPDGLARLSLVRVDGILHWRYEPPLRAGLRRRAARRTARFLSGEEVHSFKVREVAPPAIRPALLALDRKLTPEHGLRRLVGGALVRITDPTKLPDGTESKRTLLLIHGTFSNGNMFLDEFNSTAEGKEFQTWAAAHYDQVLTFDHPTLAVSPILNGADLQEALAAYKGEIDVVCHSRGGLVTSWWLRTTNQKVNRVVFVASTLNGTSLADPRHLAAALDGFANLADIAARAAGLAGKVLPSAGVWLGATAGLMKIFGGVLTAGARAPLTSAIGLIPGLAAQSPYDINDELQRLHAGTWTTNPRCYAILSDFEPGGADSPWWQFWRGWKDPGTKIADALVDPIFGKDIKNDLVVNTSSMARLRGKDFPVGDLHDYRTNELVHHINYFVQPKTFEHLKTWLT
jgi:pimeloyl-ACP methyl ester carboxylesterase